MKIAGIDEDWLYLWIQNRQNVVETMIRNMQDDIHAGYNPTGDSIRKQRIDIDAYKEETARMLRMFVGYSEEAIQRWCFAELLRVGAIEV